MTSRERVIKALRHEEPDHVPMALTSSGFTRDEPDGTDALQRFMDATGLRNYEEALDRLHTDVRWVAPTTFLGNRSLPPDLPHPFNGALRKIESVSELETIYWPSFQELWELRPDEARSEIRQAKAKGCAVMLYPAGNFYGMACDTRGKEQFWMDMLLNPGLAEAIMDKFLNISLTGMETILKECGADIDILGNCDDFGNQDRLQVSPALFRSLIKPRLAKLIAREKSLTSAFVFHHTCGSVWEIIPDLIDIGVDILNPVQVSANGMDIETLKREFGRDISFYGGGR